MTKSEEEYYKNLFGKHYNDLYQTKMSLSQRDKDRINRHLQKIRSKKEYWLNKESHSGTCSYSESDWYKLKYAESKRREYDNEIDVNEFYLC